MAEHKILRGSMVGFRVKWMLGYQGMICLAGNQVWWTWEVEDVFIKVKQGQKQAMKEFARKQNRQIDELVAQVCDGFTV